MKNILVSAAVIGVGVLVLWQTTNGFTAFTSEQLRRVEVRANPMTLPDIPLSTQDEQVLHIRDYQGHLLLVDFIFTHCAGLCPQMTSTMQRLYRLTENAGQQRKVFLLTISFDPSRDTPKRLKEYGKRFGADFHRWRFASARPSDLQKLLDAVGVVVIPQSDGQFQHNAAVHIIDRHGRLADIQNYDAVEATMASIQRLTGKRGARAEPDGQQSVLNERIIISKAEERAARSLFSMHQTAAVHQQADRWKERAAH